MWQLLSYSRWTYVSLAWSETFEALVAGLQGALWTLGASPAVLRHDNLSAATHELRRSGGRQLTVRFQQVLDHYALRSSRIQPRKPHENGVVEQSHFRTKTAIEQALLLRGERDFADESAYLRFVRTVVDEVRNAPAAARLAEERAYLRPLPAAHAAGRGSRGAVERPRVFLDTCLRESSRKRSVEMRKQMEESAAAEGARRATGAAAGRGRGERLSARRKRAVVLRLLRGEDLESVSRELRITAARASQWRDQFLAAGQAGLKRRATEARDEDYRQLQAKIGERLMETDLLYAKVDRLEASGPLARRRSTR